MIDPLEPAPKQARPSLAEIDAVLLATRVLVAVSAQSVANVDDHVTLPQLRVLVMIASRGPRNLGSVARRSACTPPTPPVPATNSSRLASYTEAITQPIAAT